MLVSELKQQVNDIFGFFVNKANDKGFVDMCARERRKYISTRCYDESTFSMIGRIKIDYSNGVGRNVEKDDFTSAEILNDTYSFYNYLDSIYAGNFNLENGVRDNVKNGYLVTIEKDSPRAIKDPLLRASCGFRIDENGNIEREIVLVNMGNFEDRGSIAHEFCHSLSKSFSLTKNYKDERMREFCTTIIDNLYLDWLIKTRPELRDKAVHSLIAHRVRNVEKARFCNRDNDLCKAICGETNREQVAKSIPLIFGEYNMPDDAMVSSASMDRLNYFRSRIDDIKSDATQGTSYFIPLYESKYVQNQIAGYEFVKMFNEKNGTLEESAHKAECIKDLKYVLENDTDLSREDAINALGMKPIEEQTKDWCDNFNSENQKLVSPNNQNNKINI